MGVLVLVLVVGRGAGVARCAHAWIWGLAPVAGRSPGSWQERSAAEAHRVEPRGMRWPQPLTPPPAPDASPAPSGSLPSAVMVSDSSALSGANSWLMPSLMPTKAWQGSA
jgi:hypothetical protein